MLDLVCDAESHHELDEIAEVFDEVIVPLVGFDVTQEDYVVGDNIKITENNHTVPCKRLNIS